MPLVDCVEDIVRWSYRHDLTLAAGAELSRYTFQTRVDPLRFFFRRIEVEVLNASEEDLNKFKRHTLIEVIIGYRVYWSGPPSRLLLEDKLQKAFKRLEKGKKKIVAHVLNDALRDGVLSFGDQEPCVITPCDHFQVQVSATTPHFKFAHAFAIRFVLDGVQARPIF